MKKIIVPRKDYRLLDWLRIAGHSKGMPIEWFYKVLLNSGKSEIEVGQFINQYVTQGILVKNYKVVGNISAGCLVDFDYDAAEA